MYTVCIAEDEYYVQKSIEARIRSLPLELEIKGIASDGMEAEKLYHEFHPDLFLVDICMPQCSGLEFIEKIRKEDQENDTIFIIVSSYYDYENMRKAINVNVFDYLRKPIVPSEFLDIMSRAVQQVERVNKYRERQKITNVKTLEEYLTEHQNIEMSGTLLILMKRKVTEPIQNLKKKLLQLGECTEIQLKNIGQIELLIFENQLIIDRQAEKIVLSNRENGIIVFHRQFKQVRIEQDLKMAEAKMTCHYFTNRFFYSISGNVSEMDFSDISYIFLKKNLLDIDMHMERFWNEISEIMMNEEHLCLFFKQYIFWLVKKYNEEKIPFPEQLKRDLLLFSMARFQTVDEIREYLQENTLQYFKCVKEKRPMELIDQISEYIHANYAQSLNLNDLASAFYISPSYLSHLFAKKKKMTIVKYIGNVRLEKSVEYLKNTELSIADIAERTGFSDGNYFAKAFKKKYGISPTDYRKMT